MRNTFRYGLASIIVAGTALGATVVACGDDDSGSSSSSGNVPEASTDAPVGDSATDAADAAKPPPAKLTFINAVTDLGDGKDLAESSTSLNARKDTAVRICFKQGTTQENLGVAPYPPLPDKPRGTQTVAGILPGTGGTFPGFPLDLQDRIIVPIVMNVKSLLAKGFVNPGMGKTGTTCDEMVGETKDAAAGLIENQDYWILPQIDAGTLKHEKSYILALTGCRGDSTLKPGKECGPGFTPGGGAGNGNLKVTIFETNTTPVSATQLGVQVFHLSPQLDAVFGPSAPNPFPLSPGFVTNPDGGVDFKAATTAPIELGKLTPVQGVTGVNDANLFVANKTSPSPDPAVAAHSLAPFPLPLIQALSGLGLPTAPTVYKDGTNYVFVAVGDPAEPTFSATDGTGPGDGGDGTVFNTKSVHFLAFPTDPVIEPYTP